MYRTIICAALFILTSISFLVKANCITNTGGTAPITTTWNAPSITVQRDIPVGSILYSGTIPPSGSAYLYCTNGGNMYYEMSLFSSTTGSEHVYATNIAGVGISVEQQNTGYFDNPAWDRKITENTKKVPTAIDVKIIKTANISSGVLDSGLLARVSGDDAITAWSIIINGSTITQLACSITTPTLVFPIGNIPASDFGSTIGFTPSQTSTQNLGLECDAGANINVQLSATQNPDVSTPSVLALNGQGESGTASGLGVQLLYNGEPLELDKRIVLKKSSGGQETFPITARYYQTKTTVTTGEASTSATLTLTYQ